MKTQESARYADPLPLAQALIRCRSVTPQDDGCIAVLERTLGQLGFACSRVASATAGPRIENLYARRGTQAPNFCFAGHTDVVPPGDSAAWQHQPFEAQVVDGTLYGRGAADMKSAIAAFIAAVARIEAPRAGSISLLITGDEEGPAIDGTARVLEWLKAKGERIDHCIVGEPTAETSAGDTVKIGRRGSLTGALTVTGVQGHVGYPDRAKNPVPGLVAVLQRLIARKLDQGNAQFQASNLEVTTIDIGNPAANVIPAQAKAVFNIRFNTEHTAQSLEDWIKTETEAATKPLGVKAEIAFTRGAHPFLTQEGEFTRLIANAVQHVTNQAPKFSTTGGTSDARFIREHCPVAEIGLAGGTMHKVDECVSLADLEKLTRIYQELLTAYFAKEKR